MKYSTFNVMVFSRNRCRAKTNKNKRCKRKTYFLFCKQHWRTKLKSKYTIWGLIAIIATLAGFYQDLVAPTVSAISNWINPPAYWECDQDRNIRGIIFDDIYTKEHNEIHLLLGLKGKQSWKIFSGAKKKRDEPSCILPAGRMGHGCALKYRITDKRKLFVSADLYDVNYCLVGKIYDNEFILNQDCGFTWNFDEKGFEVVDPEFNVVFSLHYYPPEAIAIQGVFYTGDTLVCINDNGIKFLDYSKPEEIYAARRSVKPIFEYFGRSWFGKRNPRSGVVEGMRRVSKPKISIPKHRN